MTTTSEQSAGIGGPAEPQRVIQSLRRLISLSGVGALALGSTVIGWSTTTAATTSVSGAPANAMLSATAVVQVGTNATYGNILTTSTGQALYTLNTDHNGQSTCTGSCVQVWPALTIAAGTTPTGGPGVTGTVGASMQSNGTFQVTYNGSPVYTYVGDSAPDQVNGQNVGGFFVVTIASSTTTTTVPSTTTTSSTTTTVPPTTTTSTTTTVPPTTTTSSTPTTVPPTTTTSSTPTTVPPTTTSTTVGASIAASSQSLPPTTAIPAASSSLAFTGTGKGITWFLFVGLVLFVLGLGMLAVTEAPRRLWSQVVHSDPARPHNAHELGIPTSLPWLIRRAGWGGQPAASMQALGGRLVRCAVRGAEWLLGR